ncbi:MAG: hypothetical protein IIA05_06130 [Proteobacteria bacterium]|nr:hypothetical protein [Pseudomonadota bacterium]
MPNGEYELRYLYYETAMYFGNPKVIVHCAIVAPDDCASLLVDRFYNVQRLIGPPRKYGNYVASRNCHLVREFRQVIGEASRRDRISFKTLKGKRLMGELEVVTWDYQNNPLPEENQYSRIAKLVRVLPDDDW